MADLSIALSLLKKPIEAAFATATGEIKEKIQRVKADKNIKKLQSRLNSTQKVKTIWNTDKAISITSFYYPAKISTKENTRQEIGSINDFPSNAVIIKGTAGQGKSIFLKWLLGKEVKQGARIPIFFELRKVTDTSLAVNLKNLFNELLEVDGNIDVFTHFAKEGKLSIFLDGYDEIDPEKVSQLTTQIEDLAVQYPLSRVIVTTRPDSSIENSPYFEVYSLSKLLQDDFEPFFAKILSKDKTLAKRLCTAIENSNISISTLISTPMLATLLSIVYRANQKIPSDFAEFYNELFQILLVRHDRSKAGYERKRKTNLSDREIQMIFEAFCFKIKAQKITTITKQKALEIASESIKSIGCICNESHFLTDIKNVTCLLNEEGLELNFVHQSVQEFFAAKYISSRPENVSVQFYGTCLNNQRWLQWRQELIFLTKIDDYRSRKYFFHTRN
jgi:predicted NACHT family NTPase